MSGIIQALIGGSGLLIQMINRHVVSQNVSGACTGTFRLTSTGVIQESTFSGGTQDLDFWIIPQSGMSNYECFATLNSGTPDSGTTGSWLALSSNRTWSVTRSTPGTKTIDMDIAIRRIGTTTTLATGSVIIDAVDGPS